MNGGIEYSDIPTLSRGQLAHMAHGAAARRPVAVSVRLDPDVLEWLRSKGEGHLDPDQRYPGEPAGSGKAGGGGGVTRL